MAAAGQDGLKMDLEDAQKRLAKEQEAKAKLTETNKSLQKVKGFQSIHGRDGVERVVYE